ncbi:MAG: hypothetical protein U9Q33_01635 [Campylobacterota bacterium]|nr:hypothetical protein [Campylobacterota bacterium]
MRYFIIGVFLAFMISNGKGVINFFVSNPFLTGIILVIGIFSVIYYFLFDGIIEKFSNKP